MKRATQLETKTFIQSNRGNVVTEHVEKRRFSPLLNFSTQDFHEPTSKAPFAVVFIHTNGANLNVSVDAHPFTGHRNETATVANPNVIAHLASPLAERSRLGLLDQIEHLVRIRVTQPDYLPIVRTSCFAVRSDHLMDHAQVRRL